MTTSKMTLAQLLEAAGLESPHISGMRFEFVPDDDPDRPVYGIITGVEPKLDDGWLVVRISNPVVDFRLVRYIGFSKGNWFLQFSHNIPFGAPMAPHGTFRVVD